MTDGPEKEEGQDLSKARGSEISSFSRTEQSLLRDLEKTAKPLGDVLKRGAERLAGPGDAQIPVSLGQPLPKAAADFPSYLRSLAERASTIGSLSFQLEDAAGLKQDALKAGASQLSGANLPRYLDDLRARLHALGFAGLSVRDLLQARSARASDTSGMSANIQPELRSLVAFGGPEDIRAYLEALRARVGSFRQAAFRLEQAFKEGAELLRRLETAAPPTPPVFVVPPPPPPPPPSPRPVAVAAAPEPVPIILPRPRIIDVAGQPRRGRLLILKESIWSHRRLRWLILLIALLALMIAFATGWFWNRSYAMQRFARGTVSRMQNAVSYRAAGVDFVRDSKTTTEIRESFEFLSPASVSTNYLTTVRQTGSDSILQGACVDKDIVVLSATRYQRCNDKDTTVKGWVVDSYDPRVFDTYLFEPWSRFAWCTDIKEKEQIEMVGGVPTIAYSCEVPAIREARVIFEQKGTGTLAGGGLTAKEREEKVQKFVKEAKIEITVWVRQTDGYIGRFAIVKTAPGSDGPVTETGDIRYSDFNLVPPIPPPDTALPVDEPPKENRNARPSVATIADRVFFLEVATDDFTRQQGLAGRDPATFPQDRGMLFMFPTETRQRFWMKDVRMPLDIIFLDNTKRIVDMTTMHPQPGVADNQLRVHESRLPVLWVLEINGGLAQQYGFQMGRVVEFQ